MDKIMHIYKYFTSGAALEFKPGQGELHGRGNPLLRRLAARLRFEIPIRVDTMAGSAFASLASKFVESPKKEAYLLSVTSEGAVIHCADGRGALYGMFALLAEGLEGRLRELELYEEPLLEKRILKLYLPPPTAEGMEEFRSIIEFAASCRFNCIMLELGGAMEYKSHPEINEGWKEYAAIMNEYPGKTSDVQNQFPWRKNSIHSENGGGRCVSQGMTRRIIALCRQYCMDIIPEVPCLSHSDYLLFRHRELAERPEDPFPDTCCPSNPAYHGLLFDILDEVMALFSHSTHINICHDEYYTMCKCEKCRGRKAHELYAEDINRIAAYLASHGRKAIIWGEKLLDSHFNDGEPIGGAAAPATDGMEGMPPLWPCRDLVDPSIGIFHWYWSVSREYEKVYAERGMDYYFANLNPVIFKDWKRRMSAPLVKGVCLSNWGQTSMRTLQRNAILYEMMYTSLLLWNDSLGTDDYPSVNDAVMRRLYAMRRQSFPREAELLEILHTVRTPIKYRMFFDGFILDEKTYFLGEHVFRSKTSGRMYGFPVVFGTNIANADTDTSRRETPDRIDDTFAIDLQFLEPSWEAMPEIADDGTVWYRTSFALPPGVHADDLEYLRFQSAHALVPAVSVRLP